MTIEDSPIWTFSLRLYGSGGFSAAAIALQDQWGADVDVLLHLCFLACHGRVVAPGEASDIDACVSAWQDEVVKPLRALRRRLKSGVPPVAGATSEGIRKAAMQLELECERAELDALAQAFPPERFAAADAAPADLARTNVMAYAAHLGGFPAAPVESLVAAVRLLPQA